MGVCPEPLLFPAHVWVPLAQTEVVVLGPAGRGGHRINLEFISWVGFEKIFTSLVETL